MSASFKRSAIHKSLLRVGTKQIDTKQTTSRLCPINKAPKGQTLYDTIAFLIFCPKHRTLAVCNTYHLNRENALWLPFIYRSNKVNYSVAIEDGLCLILSDYDFKLLIEYKEELPFHTNIIDAIEVNFPKANQVVTRINCLATLHDNIPGFHCCRKTSRIYWLSVEEIRNNNSIRFYGPEHHIYCMSKNLDKLRFKDEIFVEAPELYQAKSYYRNYTINTSDGYLLNSLGITKRQIDLLSNDFFEHCFPSLVMSFESFADYLSKYGFREKNAKINRLFNAFKDRKSIDPFSTWPHVSFNALLIGLACIDKDSPQDICRVYFVFDYYDLNRDGFLSEDEFREMVTDIHKNEGQEEIDRIVADGMTGNRSPNGMNYKEFYNRAETHQFGDATHLGKSNVQWIRHITKVIESKTTRPLDTFIKQFKSISFRH